VAADPYFRSLKKLLVSYHPWHRWTRPSWSKPLDDVTLSYPEQGHAPLWFCAWRLVRPPALGSETGGVFEEIPLHRPRSAPLRFQSLLGGWPSIPWPHAGM